MHECIRACMGGVVCVCMHVCMYVCTYVRIYVCMHVGMHVVVMFLKLDHWHSDPASRSCESPIPCQTNATSSSSSDKWHGADIRTSPTTVLKLLSYKQGGTSKLQREGEGTGCAVQCRPTAFAGRWGVAGVLRSVAVNRTALRQEPAGRALDGFVGSAAARSNDDAVVQQISLRMRRPNLRRGGYKS